MSAQTHEAAQRKGGAVRAYTLRLYPNPGKAKEAFGILLEQRTWLHEFVRQHMMTGEETWTTSTKGLGFILDEFTNSNSSGIMLPCLRKSAQSVSKSGQSRGFLETQNRQMGWQAGALTAFTLFAKPPKRTNREKLTTYNIERPIAKLSKRATGSTSEKERQLLPKKTADVFESTKRREWQRSKSRFLPAMVQSACVVVRRVGFFSLLTTLLAMVTGSVGAGAGSNFAAIPTTPRFSSQPTPSNIGCFVGTATVAVPSTGASAHIEIAALNLRDRARGVWPMRSGGKAALQIRELRLTLIPRERALC
jgi:hypothetical protein